MFNIKIKNMKNENKWQCSSTAKFIMIITIIMMIGTLFGTIGHLISKIPCSCMTENKEFKKIVRNEIDSWQAYGDEKYNFQVKYPINISDPAISEKENAGKKELQKEINFNINDDSRISIYVWNMEASEGNDLAEAKEKYNEVSIGGNYGWQSKQDSNAVNENKDPTAIYSLETYLYSKTHIYQIEYRGIYNTENFDLYQKMISTFEVGEEKDETADWQIYRNEEYGFEFKYPETFNLDTNLILHDWTKDSVTSPGEFYYKAGQNRWKNRMVHRVNYTKGDLCISPDDIAPVTDYDLSQINCVIYQVDSNYVIKYSNPDSVDYILGLNKGEVIFTFDKTNDFLFDQILSTFKFTEK